MEAQRLGAAVYGVDVDPLAVFITSHQLEHLDIVEFSEVAAALLAYLTERFDARYGLSSEDRVPLHYFYLRRVTCPACGETEVMRKNLAIARDLGRDGAVVRDSAIVAFCPECFSLHEVGAKRKVIDCCGRRHRLYEGNFSHGRYRCGCGEASTNEGLRTAMSPRVLIAVEETDPAGRRKIRPPAPNEVAHEVADRQQLVEEDARLVLPRAALSPMLKRHKPGIYGFDSMDSLFSPGQLLFFGTAFRWLAEQSLSHRTRSALALALSNALASNNLLCGYATDYGRLAQLFSVRDYSLPVLTVELNPLHPKAGRGTLPATVRRVSASKRDSSSHDARDASVHVADAAAVTWPEIGGLDIVMTDPPYFDYIAYSDLSEFFRVWLGAAGIIDHDLTGTPLYEGVSSRDDFSNRLGESFKRAASQLKPGGLMAFTYHATTTRGWDALADAITGASLVVTEAFPLWADAKSPGHGHDGNVEYDIVLCCRPAETSTWTRFSTEAWVSRFANTKISAADRAAWSLAVQALNEYAKVD